MPVTIERNKDECQSRYNQSKRHWPLPDKLNAVGVTNRSSEIIFKQLAKDKADQHGRERVICKAHEDGKHTEAKEQKKFGRIVLAYVGSGHGEKKYKRNQVGPWNRQQSSNVGNQRQVED